MIKNEKNDSSKKKGLRKRKLTNVNKEDDKPKDSNVTEVNGPTLTTDDPVSVSLTVDAQARVELCSHWFTRIVLLRCLGLVYFVAFLVALQQNKQLIGKDGLLPAHKFLNNIKNRAGGINLHVVLQCPTILWFLDYNNYLDGILDTIAYTGLALSLLMTLHGAANWAVLSTLWILNHSVVNIGQKWYAFGWENQLLETGFLFIFLCPVWTLSPFPKHSTPPVIIWSIRWMLFRRMIGAGLIKIRGDKCWRDLTCMNYHYETQPVPNPVSYYLHQSPQLIHMMEILGNHFIELVAPFFLFMGRRMTIIGGTIQIFFQGVLIISGNLSFLNWLTIVPSLACFDDRSLSWMFSTRSQAVREQLAQIQQETDKKSKGSRMRQVFHIMFGLVMVYLSLPVLLNLLSSRQRMNHYYNPLRIVNTYGAFGSVTKERTELIFSGTSSSDPSDLAAVWLEYEFKCKPGNISRRPCLISPYHYRLDWLVWFAAFQNYQYNPWLVHVAIKLLANDEGTTSLIAHNPFEDKDPPKFLRAEHYRYQYTKIGSRAAGSGAWWTRKHLGNYLPPLSLKSVRDIAKQMDWDMPKVKKRNQ